MNKFTNFEVIVEIFENGKARIEIDVADFNLQQILRGIGEGIDLLCGQYWMDGIYCFKNSGGESKKQITATLKILSEEGIGSLYISDPKININHLLIVNKNPNEESSHVFSLQFTNEKGLYCLERFPSSLLELTGEN